MVNLISSYFMSKYIRIGEDNTLDFRNQDKTKKSFSILSILFLITALA